MNNPINPLSWRLSEAKKKEYKNEITQEEISAPVRQLSDWILRRYSLQQEQTEGRARIQGTQLNFGNLEHYLDTGTYI